MSGSNNKRRSRPIVVAYQTFNNGYTEVVEISEPINVSDCLAPVVQERLQEFDADAPIFIDTQEIKLLSSAWPRWLKVTAWGKDDKPIIVSDDRAGLVTGDIKFHLRLTPGFKQAIKQILFT